MCNYGKLPFQCQTLWELLWVQFYTLEVGTVKSFDFVVGTQFVGSKYRARQKK